MKLLSNRFLFLVIVILLSCKKETPHYAVSQEMKGYFAFQKGSYWVYMNDSTGIQDSSYVISVTSAREVVGDNDGNTNLYSYDLLTTELKNDFIKKFVIGYYCLGPNTIVVTSKFKHDSNSIGLDNLNYIAYFQGWGQYVKISSEDCLSSYTVLCQFYSSLAIDDIIYTNVIHSRIISNDSTSSNKYFYLRDIYFGKGIGILKYFEKSSYNNFIRSLSLLRYKTIQ